MRRVVQSSAGDQPANRALPGAMWFLAGLVPAVFLGSGLGSGMSGAGAITLISILCALAGAMLAGGARSAVMPRVARVPVAAPVPARGRRRY